MLLEQGVGCGGQGRRQRPHLFTEPPERRGGGRIRPLLTATDDLMPKKVTCMAGVAIGDIFAPALPVGEQPVSHPLPPDDQKRPDQRDAFAELPSRGHARHSRWPRAAHDAVENRFGLVVGGMGDRHVTAAGLAGRLCEEPIPQPSGPSLEPFATRMLSSANLQSPRHEADAQPPRQGGDDIPIDGRLGPQIVLGVGYDQPGHGLGAWGQGDESQQQCRAISTSRNADHGRRLPEAMLRQARFDRGQKRITSHEICHEH